MSAILRAVTLNSWTADTAEEQRLVRLRYLARRIHALGERPLFEMLLELERGAALMPTLERYARLPASFIRAWDGDRLNSFVVIDGDAEERER